MDKMNTEWLSEPNTLEWEHEGYRCLLVRQPLTGYFCGYVALPDDHPWKGKYVRDLEKFAINVHGGISYAEEGLPIDTFAPSPQMWWWLGFDAGHCTDISPFRQDNKPFPGATYKNMAFMKDETEKLARQCKEAEISEKWQKHFDGIKKEMDKYEATPPIRRLMLKIIKQGYAAVDTYNRGKNDRKICFDSELIQAHNMLIDMAKWGYFSTKEATAETNVAEKKPYTCECKYEYARDDWYKWHLAIGVCQNKDPENIRLCKLATKIWDNIFKSKGFLPLSFDNGNDEDSYAEKFTRFRFAVFKTLAAEESE